MVYSIYQALTMKSENTVFQTYISRDDTKASDLEFGKWCGEKSMEPCGGRPCDVRTLCACLRSLEAASWLHLACSFLVPGCARHHPEFAKDAEGVVSPNSSPSFWLIQHLARFWDITDITSKFQAHLRSRLGSRWKLPVGAVLCLSGSGFDRHVPPLAPTCQRCWSSSRGRCWDPSFVILSGSNLVPLRLGPKITVDG